MGPACLFTARRKKTRNETRLRRSTFGFLGARRLLAIVDWTGGGNGTSWSDATNWSGDVGTRERCMHPSLGVVTSYSTSLYLLPAAAKKRARPRSYHNVAGPETTTPACQRDGDLLRGTRLGYSQPPHPLLFNSYYFQHRRSLLAP